MKRSRGDLWDWHERGYRIVISTNIGYDPVSYRNNMGAGIALQAMLRYPGLPGWYGRQCAEHRELTPVLERQDLRLLFFPVKPFVASSPERGWAQNGSMALIRSRLPQLVALARTGAPVALSTVGAGPKGSGGGLQPAAVARLIERATRELADGQVVLVDYDRIAPAGA